MSQVPTDIMDAMWKAMRGRSFDALRLTVSDAVAEGYPMSAVLSQLHSDVLYKQGLSDLEKALICTKIASVSLNLLSMSRSGMAFSNEIHHTEDVPRHNFRIITDINVIQQADQNLSDGASEALQLSDVAAFIMRTLTRAPIAADKSYLTH